jgi:hypothetical protein
LPELVWAPRGKDVLPPGDREDRMGLPDEFVCHSSRILWIVVREGVALRRWWGSRGRRRRFALMLVVR